MLFDNSTFLANLGDYAVTKTDAVETASKSDTNDEKNERGFFAGVSKSIDNAVTSVTESVSGALFRVALVIVGLLVLYIGLQSYLPKIGKL